MDQSLYDVIIIGAGASGLIAAYELSLTGRKVAVLEARDRLGGRIHTVANKKFSVPVESGAEFIHGKLKLTKSLLKHAGISSSEVEGELWQNKSGELSRQEDFIEDYTDLEKKFKQLKDDLPVAAFIEKYLKDDKYEELRFTLKNYVEGYYAAELSKASTYALCEELNTSDEEQFRIEGGYSQLMIYLAEQSKKHGCIFHYSHVAEQVNWSKNKIEVITPSRTLHATKLLITIPLGVLQQEKIHFNPGVPEKINAVRELGFGPVIKIIIEFRDAFWKHKQYTRNKDLSKLSFLFSRQEIPTWWTNFPSETSLLTGWIAGPRAEALKNNSKEEILHKSLLSLQSIFYLEVGFLEQNLKAWDVYNWAIDEYNLGGYAYEVVNGPRFRQIVKEPLSETIYFAGEGLFDGPEIGTVEAALISGRDTAHNIIASL
jgi:monoamine oxidase